ncbi:MAG: two-component sensor histidine kinase [Desulfovibrionaceae bacterium]|nr:two-component sensor histidine kinase [Desulfovibrionaceae bacterium]
MKKGKISSYDRLTRNIALTVITVSLAPLILVGGVIFDQFRSIYEEKVYSHLSEVVDKHATNIDAFLRDKLYEIQYLNTAYSYEQLTSAEFLDETLRGMQQQFGRIFVDFGVIDAHGRQVAYAGPFKLLGADYSNADWYRKSRDRNAYVSDVFEGLRQSPHFIITINNGKGERAWTLRATVDFLAFSHLVENIRIGKTGFAYILNDQGVFQTKPHEDQAEKLVLTPGKRIETAGAEGGVTIRHSEGSDGEIYITVSSPLNGGNWELVYQQSLGDAFSDMIRAEYVVLIIFALGGLGIVAMAVLVSRKLVGRCRAMDKESELMNRQMVETGKLAAIGELAAGIAHEINNPVAIMIEEAGWVGDLLKDEAPPMPSRGEIDRALNQVVTQGRRCKDITHKLLSFARQTDPRVTEVSLPALIREVVELSMQPAKYGHVDFSLNLDQDMPPVAASMSELQQVFLNLVNNSIQAMEADGGVLTLGCSRQGNDAVVTVQDTGPGIPAANLGRIFDPFFTTKPVGKGSGLGLSICFGIIHQMGGDIEVESAVGVGTKFTVRLPFPPPADQQERQQEMYHD